MNRDEFNRDIAAAVNKQIQQGASRSDVVRYFVNESIAILQGYAWLPPDLQAAHKALLLAQRHLLQ